MRKCTANEFIREFSSNEEQNWICSLFFLALIYLRWISVSINLCNVGWLIYGSAKKCTLNDNNGICRQTLSLNICSIYICAKTNCIRHENSTNESEEWEEKGQDGTVLRNNRQPRLVISYIKENRHLRWMFYAQTKVLEGLTRSERFKRIFYHSMIDFFFQQFAISAVSLYIQII